jgi:hypothetical protein
MHERYYGSRKPVQDSFLGMFQTLRRATLFYSNDFLRKCYSVQQKEKAEEIYLPILDARLTPQEAERMFEAMEYAAKEAKSNLG